MPSHQGEAGRAVKMPLSNLADAARRWLWGGLVMSAAIAGLPALACTTEDIARFEGQWYGQGRVRPDADSAPEPMACRLVFEPGAQGEITTRGICATATQTQPVSGHLSCQEGTLSGALLSQPEAEEPRLLEATQSGTATLLELEGRHPVTGEVLRYSLEFGFEDNGALAIRMMHGGLVAMRLLLERETP